MDPQHVDCGGGGHTGWNLAWSANLWARLMKGDKALATIEEQMKRQVNENLFNRCGGPFQIDGNLGAPAAIAEMLVQSRLRADGAESKITDRKSQSADLKYEIDLLPALPKDWASGSAKGLRTRGGYSVDMEWKDGKVIACRIKGRDKQEVKVRMNGKIKTIETSVGLDSL